MPPLFHQYLINDSGERTMHGGVWLHKQLLKWPRQSIGMFLQMSSSECSHRFWSHIWQNEDKRPLLLVWHHAIDSHYACDWWSGSIEFLIPAFTATETILASLEFTELFPIRGEHLFHFHTLSPIHLHCLWCTYPEHVPFLSLTIIPCAWRHSQLWGAWTRKSAYTGN